MGESTATRAPRLSICIPTYNFGCFLGETLENVLQESNCDVEIVVVDGGSTDNTQQIVKSFAERYPNLVYFRRERNVGVDRDVFKAVELASGDYCWLFSSDDLMEKGAISRMTSEIFEGHDVYLCNRMECDIKMKPRQFRPWLDKMVGDKVFELSGDKEFREYLRLCHSIGALFSYLSSIVVSRHRWNSTEVPTRAFGTHYATAFRILSMRNKGLRIKYIEKPLVFCRGENDSFLAEGMLGRIRLDLDGYDFLANELIKDLTVRRAFKQVMIREHPYDWLARVREELKDDEEWKILLRSLRKFGYDSKKVTLVAMRVAFRRFRTKLFRMGRR